MFWCDYRCSGKALRFWQFASAVVDAVVESYTSVCVSSVTTKDWGLAPLKSWQWKAVVEKKGASWQTVENVGKRPVYTRNVGVISLLQERKRKSS